MLKVIEFLKEHTLEDLHIKYAIDIKRHGRYNNLVLLKYNAIDSPMGEEIVQECRGLILDENKDWEIVSCPYFKFFNYGERESEKNIDWTTAKVYEKIDGSLMTLYWYDNEWQVSSSGMPDAQGEVSDFGFTFEKLFWDVWEELGYILPKDTSKCYMFELMTPYNRIVVQHKKNSIVLHGVRDLKTLKELDPYFIALKHEWQCVCTFSLRNLDEILTVCKELNPIESEGYVVCDANFNRIKVKSPQYVALAHIKDGMSVKRILEIIRANESDEFLNYFPEFKDLYRDIKLKYDNFVSEMEKFYSKIKDIQDQKSFALEAVKSKYPAVLFFLKKNPESTVKQYLSQSNVNHFMERLELR